MTLMKPTHIETRVRLVSTALAAASVMLSLAAGGAHAQAPGSIDGEAVGEGAGELAGQVVDGDTGEAVAGVVVTVTGRALPRAVAVTTDDSGSYRLSGLALGTYALSFMKEGYAGEPIAGVEVRGTAPLRYDAVIYAGSSTLAYLNAETSVASGTSTKLSETPGIVTVVTRDEIIRAGARDLIDVLQLVPGFNFALDVVSVVGAGFRGIWGHEGKVLVLWDGHEMNETLYLTPSLGQMYPIDAIEKIEIIRGPGSALYGGSAELAVINIVPRGASLNGMNTVARYGQMAGSFGHATGQLSYGQRPGGALEGLELAVDVYGGEGVLSDRTYDDGYGSRYAMTWENQSSSPTWLSASASYKGLQLRVLGSMLRNRTQDDFGVALPAPVNNNFSGLFTDLRYEWRPTDNVVITPRLSWKRQAPWNGGTVFLEEQPFDSYYNKIADRLRGQLVVAADPFEGMNVMAGVDSYLDSAALVLGPSGYVGLNQPFFNGKDEVAFWNVAAFGQVLIKTPMVNITAGARVENHQQYGASFVPRVALTRSWENLHAKVLVSGAFKAPGIENINLNEDIRPERTRVIEGEVSYKISSGLAFAANIFDIDLNSPIVYFYDDLSGDEAYVNGPATGSRGAELELRMREGWGSLYLTYSFASVEDKNRVDLYETPEPEASRGLPVHKVTANMSLKLSDHLYVTPTAVILSERYGWLGAIDDDGAEVVGRVGLTPLLNVAAVYEDLLVNGLDLTLGVYNALDIDYRFIQAYDGGHAPLPARSREVLGRVSYEVQF